MLKMKVSYPDGRPLFVLGLSEMNLRKLRDGDPILVKLATLGGTDDVLIYAGATEKSMMKDLQDAGLLPAAGANPPHEN